MSIPDLHTPSSTSAPLPTGNAASPPPDPTIQSEAVRLTSLKDAITARLDLYFEVLKTNNVTMATPLVDPEGFPRSDIDVAGIRTARSQINRLKNDLKGVMGEMAALLEKGLPRVEAPAGTVEADGTVPEAGRDGEGPTAFAKVDGVFPNGPGALAGLKRGDHIVSIGPINASNHDSLQALAALVAQSEGVTLPLVISRPSTEGDEPASQVLHLRLTPKLGWGGRGLLGSASFLPSKFSSCPDPEPPSQLPRRTFLTSPHSHTRVSPLSPPLFRPPPSHPTNGQRFKLQPLVPVPPLMGLDPITLPFPISRVSVSRLDWYRKEPTGEDGVVGGGRGREFLR